MYYAGLAEEFYHSACPNHTMNGYEKNVLMNVETEKCIFVSGDVQPSENELLFRIKRAHGNTVTTLKTPRKEKVRSTAQSVAVDPAKHRYEGIVRPAIYVPPLGQPRGSVPRAGKAEQNGLYRP